MDRALFIAATGARELMQRQAVISNNMANASTPGFRQEFALQRTAPVLGGPGLRTRAYAVETTPGTDMSHGSVMSTNRDLDVAIPNEGFFAVRTADGGEAYTRAGAFFVTAEGELVDATGRSVLGSDSQPINVPPNAQIGFNQDGSISSVSRLDVRDSQLVGYLKLVNPPVDTVERGGDGLFRPKAGGTLEHDPTVQVSDGMLENSNVNPVNAMVDMIAAARQFDLNVALMKTAQENQQTATSILTVSA